MKTVEKILKEIKDMRDIQQDSLTDDYMIGLYNGLLLAISVIEGKEPDFKTPPNRKWSDFLP